MFWTDESLREVFDKICEDNEEEIGKFYNYLIRRVYRMIFGYENEREDIAAIVASKMIEKIQDKEFKRYRDGLKSVFFTSLRNATIDVLRVPGNFMLNSNGNFKEHNDSLHYSTEINVRTEHLNQEDLVIVEDLVDKYCDGRTALILLLNRENIGNNEISTYMGITEPRISQLRSDLAKKIGVDIKKKKNKERKRRNKGENDGS